MKTKFDYINILNLYGLSIPLRYKSQKKYNTFIGFILTIISIIILILGIIYFLIQLFNENNFSLISSKEKINENIDFSQIPLIIGLVNKSNNNFYEINNKYFNLSSNLISQKEDYIENKILKFEKCNLSKLKDYINFYSKKYEESNNFECIQEGQEIILKNGYYIINNKFSSVLTINLNLCDNKYEKCNSMNEIKEKINNSLIFLIYLGYQINHENKENPVSRNIITEYFELTYEYQKNIYFKFSKSNYTTQNNLITNSKKKFNFFENSLVFLDFTPRKSNTLIKISFINDGTLNIYYRKYKKFQEVIGELGGLINCVVIIFKFITVYISKKILLIDISQTLICDDCRMSYNLNFKSNEVFQNFPNLISNNNMNNKNINKSEKNKEKEYLTIYKKKQFNQSNDNLNISENIKKINSFDANKIVKKVKLFDKKENVNEENKKIYTNDNNNQSMKSLDLKTILNIISNPVKQYFNLNWYEFILPNFLLKKKEKYLFMNKFHNLLHNYVSVEKLIKIFLYNESIMKDFNTNCFSCNTNYYKFHK